MSEKKPRIVQLWSDDEDKNNVEKLQQDKEYKEVNMMSSQIFKITCILYLYTRAILQKTCKICQSIQQTVNVTSKFQYMYSLL